MAPSMLLATTSAQLSNSQTRNGTQHPLRNVIILSVMFHLLQYFCVSLQGFSDLRNEVALADSLKAVKICSFHPLGVLVAHDLGYLRELNQGAPVVGSGYLPSQFGLGHQYHRLNNVIKRHFENFRSSFCCFDARSMIPPFVERAFCYSEPILELCYRNPFFFQDCFNLLYDGIPPNLINGKYYVTILTYCVKYSIICFTANHI